MISHTSYLSLFTIISFVFFLEYGAEKLQLRGLSNRKSYYITGFLIFVFFLGAKLISETIFNDKKDIDPSILMHGDIKFIASVLVGFTFVQLVGEIFEKPNLSKFKSQLIAIAIFMASYIGLDMILMAMFNA